MVDYAIYQIHTEENFTYAAVGTGLGIFDTISGTSLYTKTIPGSLSTNIWGNNTTLYISGIDGLYQITYEALHDNYIESTISGSYYLSSTDIQYIHGKENQLLICTSSGVDYIHHGINPEIHSKIYRWRKQVFHD